MSENPNTDDHVPSSLQYAKLAHTDLLTTFETSDTDGLTTSVANQRLAENGPNELASKKVSNWVRFFKQFNNSIIYILIAAALITMMLRHWSDAIVITLVIITNALIGYFQEQQASAAIEKIRQMLVTEAMVIRDGHRTVIPASELVIGDLVNLEAGDRVPADMVLLSADNLRVQESILTGEADSVLKTEDPIEEDRDLADQSNMVFASTSVTNGNGLGIVVATAEQTQLGQIQQSVVEVKEKPTPLMHSIDRLGRQLSIGIVVVAVLLFVVGAYFKVYALPTLLIAVITMVVGSIPEGLPASTSVILAMGVRGLTSHNAIVKTLPAVETLGAVSVINTDKTGTLTQNEMTIQNIVTPNHDYTVTGIGYQPTGEILDANGHPVTVTKQTDLETLLEVSGITTDAELNQEEGQWVVTGEPTDGAFEALYQKVYQVPADFDEVDSLPFDSDTRFNARLINEHSKRILMIKGSPDKIFEMVDSSTINETEMTAKTQAFAAQGQRVIALAQAEVTGNEITMDLIQQTKFTFVGLVSMIDPPRDEVVAAIKSIRGAGVQVKMITGDHPVTASAIAAKLGLADDVKSMTGADLQKLSDEQLSDMVDETTVFARTTPADKLRIVAAEQSHQNITAMTGDGVNDAPALKKADIGIAMGIKGTDVAKESANMVLANDDFTTLSYAIEEGRRIYDNIKKSVRFLLPTSFAEGLIVLISIMLGQQMPLFPTQLLWINMVSAMTIQFAFIFEPAEHGIMNRGPRSSSEPLLNKMDVFELIYVSILIAGLGIAAFNWLTAMGMSNVVASTVTLNIVVFGKIGYLFNIRTSKPAVSKEFFSNKMAFVIILILIVLQLIITYGPFMQGVFHTGNMSAGLWLIPIVAAVIVLVITEIDKAIRTAMSRRAASK